MIDLGKYVHTPTGRMVISALLGIGLAAMFKEVCVGPQCMINTGVADLGAIYKWGGLCYKIKAAPVSCNISTTPYKKVVQLGAHPIPSIGTLNM